MNTRCDVRSAGDNKTDVAPYQRIKLGILKIGEDIWEGQINHLTRRFTRV